MTIKSKMISVKYVFVWALICLLPAVTQAEERVYTVGVVPQFASTKINGIWSPILDELSEKTGLTFKLQGSLDIPNFEKQFNAGEFDFAYMNPYHLIVANEEQGYVPIARDVGRSLFGIIVVRKDSEFTDVKDLDGKKIAFPAPNALGAALIPRTEFSKKFDMEVEEKYVSSHSSVYLNVILGQTAAGGGVQKTLSQQPEAIQSQLKIIYKTTEVPPHPIAVHPRVDEDVRQKVVDALLEMGETDAGKKMLALIPMKEIGNTALEDYQFLKDMGLAEFYVK